MRKIAVVHAGNPGRDQSFTLQLFNDTFAVRIFGTAGDPDRLARQVRAAQEDGAEAIGLAAPAPELERVRREVQVPVVDGQFFLNTYARYALKLVDEEQHNFFGYKHVLALPGKELSGPINFLGSLTDWVTWGDPALDVGLPLALRRNRLKAYYSGQLLPRLRQIGFSRLARNSAPGKLLNGAMQNTDILLVTSHALRRLEGLKLERKTVVVDVLTSQDLEQLRRQGAQTVVALYGAPDFVPPLVGAELLDAVFAAVLRSRGEKVDIDHAPNPSWAPNMNWALNLLPSPDLQPQVIYPQGGQPGKNLFAFVIHPLRTEDIFKNKMLRWLRFLPSAWIERAVANISPIYLSRIRGVRSKATGQEVEGILLSLGATPRELMRRHPSFAYRRLIRAARMAERMGARIMGLGAFTSVVGDAGITVAQKSDIAITSGNSLTVAATLEAAKQAAIKMGHPLDQGRAVVVGATGSIGSVCARLLAQALKDVVLIAPRPEKLIELKKVIESETPGAKVIIATTPGDYIAGADLIVTTTSALTGKVIDVMKLKPGAVVCDVARPPDVSAEDAAKRPDVLVIESGEIRLPGDPDFGFDIGLPPKTAYACLAETALLAMEGIFEDYTLGRNIEMERVKEMYRLFKKHGLELAGLRSHGHFLTDEDIAQRRKLAEERRARQGLANAKQNSTDGAQSVAGVDLNAAAE
ncbi:MAG: serine carboxypeptidase [Chloroflexi bacterium]|nr:serine carboxypeptidase [Chloroflexota bacterium]